MYMNPSTVHARINLSGIHRCAACWARLILLRKYQARGDLVVMTLGTTLTNDMDVWNGEEFSSAHPVEGHLIKTNPSGARNPRIFDDPVNWVILPSCSRFTFAVPLFPPRFHSQRSPASLGDLTRTRWRQPRQLATC